MIRILFFAIIVRFVVLVIIGLNVRRRHLLPKTGPAIVVANHNSHLDAMVLMSLMPLRQLSRIHPVAAADYFFKNKLLAWFAKHVIGIIPISRGGKQIHPFTEIDAALAAESIIIYFPEGTRGEPEVLSEFKSGIMHMAKRNPSVPVIPVYMHGLGKALPKGDIFLVPFFCDVCVAEALPFNPSREEYLKQMDQCFERLAAEVEVDHPAVLA